MIPLDDNFSPFHQFQNCSRILLKKEDREVELRRTKRPNLTYLEKKSIKKQILLKCKKVSICPYCGQYNGEY